LSSLFFFERIVLLTGLYRCFKPVFWRYKGTSVGFTVGAPGIVRLVKIENPFPFGGAVSLGFQIKVSPGTICILA
jgi:hypothetical protein